MQKINYALVFFGDKMQSIYDNGVGDIQQYIDYNSVKEIKKADNYRCSQNVINLLNNIRNDIKQKPSQKNSDGTIANKTGSAIFLYSDENFDLEKFKQKGYFNGWNFDNVDETKVLFLTHRLSAVRLGFGELLKAYKYTDNLLGNEPDVLASHLLNIGNILYNYKEQNYSVVLDSIQKKIEHNDDKQQISSALSNILSSLETRTIEDIINLFYQEKLLKKSNKFKHYIENYSDTYDKVKILPSKQILSYFSYYNSYSPYSTQHGIKGAEFENVLVVLDNGNWNTYNFNYYFENRFDKETIMKRTEKIFYQVDVSHFP